MKKIYWIILIVIFLSCLIVLGLFLWTRHAKAELSKRHQNLIEIPSGVDYQNIKETQTKVILEAIVKKFPKTKTEKDKHNKTYPVPQNIILTKDGATVDSGQTPMRGDIQIEPSGPINDDNQNTNQNQNDNNNGNNVDNTDPDNQSGNDGTDDSGSDDQSGNQDNQDDADQNQPPALQMPTIMYSGLVYADTDQTDLINKLKEIKALVEKYYPEIVKIYGEPYDVKNRTISIVYDSEYDFSGYFPQYDTVYVNDTDAISVIPDFINSFLGTKSSGYPETWLYGSLYVTFIAVAQHFPEDAWQAAWIQFFLSKDYEKFNVPDYPIWGTNIFYPNDILGSAWTRVVQASAALDKAYLTDNQFFVNLNQQMYQIDFNEWYRRYDTEQLFDKVSSAWPSVEGKSATTWYKMQHVLHQTETDSARLIKMIHFGQTLAIVLNYDDPSLDVIQIFDYQSSAGFTPKQSRSISITISDHEDKTVLDQSFTTGNNGIIQKKLNEIGITTDGRYMVNLDDDSPYFHFNYFTKPNIHQLNGVVGNFGQGAMAAYDQNKTLLEEVPITNGAFQFSKDLSGFLDLKVKDYHGNIILEKLLMKDLGSYYVYLVSPIRSYPSGSQTRGPSSRGSDSNCQVDTTGWQSYDGGEYTIKYPKDWFSDQKGSQEGNSYWFVSFGPQDLASLVYIGGSAPDINQFKQDLIAVSGQGFQIKAEGKETVSGAEATKLSVEGGPNYPYLTYIYYIPLGNVPAIIKGPARSDYFVSSCEPEIFAEMVKSYSFRGMGPWTGSENTENNSDNQTYTDAACGFLFQYPQDWKITENYYYETAGGEKATTPTIILKNDAGDATININLRQKFCLETPDVSKTREPLYGGSPIYIDFMNYLDQGQTCGQVDITAPDKNGKDSSYRIVAEFPTSSDIKEVFKDFVRSFQRTK